MGLRFLQVNRPNLKPPTILRYFTLLTNPSLIKFVVKKSTISGEKNDSKYNKY